MRYTLRGGCAAMLLTSWLVPAAMAADAAMRVAVVDLNRVRREYEKARKLADKVDAEAKRLNQELEEKRKQIKSMENQLAALPTNSPEYRSMLKEMNKMLVETKIKKELDEIELRLQDFTGLRETVQEIYDKVGEMAKQRGLQLILFKDDFQLDDEDEKNPDLFVRKVNSRKVIYVADELDLTNDVIAGLNKDYRLGKFPGGSTTRPGRNGKKNQ